jgi:hypothetical protein
MERMIRELQSATVTLQGDTFSTDTFLAGDGSIAAPSYSWESDPDNGFFLVGANQIGVVTGGTKRFDFTTGYLAGIATGAAAIKHSASSLGAPAYSFSGDTDTGIDRSGADILRLVCGGTSVMVLTATTTGFVTGTTGTAANLQQSSSGSNVARFTSALKYKSDLSDADHLADIELKPMKFYREDDDRYFYGFIADWLGEQDALLGNYVDGEIETYDDKAVLAVLAAKIRRIEDERSRCSCRCA